MEDYVTLERSDDTMIVRFDRQGALNAFDQKMITELTDIAKLLAEDLTVRSVVLTGASVISLTRRRWACSWTIAYGVCPVLFHVGLQLWGS